MGFETLDATRSLGTHSFGLPVYVSSEMIDTQVRNLALELRRRFPIGTMPVFVPVLSGGIYFYNDLSLALQSVGEILPHEVAYVSAKRYGAQTAGRQDVDMNWWDLDRTDLRGKTVMLVDDILDEGVTATAITSGLRERGTHQVLSAFACRKVPVKPCLKQTTSCLTFPRVSGAPATAWIGSIVFAMFGKSWERCLRSISEEAARLKAENVKRGSGEPLPLFIGV